MHASDIVNEPLIFPKTGFTRQMLDKLFRPYRSRLHISMELASVGMIKRFVAAGLGVSLISASFARDEVRAGKVKLIPLEGANLWRELGLVYRRDRSLPLAVDAFVSLVRERAPLQSPVESPAAARVPPPPPTKEIPGTLRHSVWTLENMRVLASAFGCWPTSARRRFAWP